MSYFNPLGGYGGQQQQPNPWAAIGGKQQTTYTPLVGPPPATREDIAEYRRLKRRNTILTIALVVIIILLIAAVVAVFTIAFLPKSATSGATTIAPTPTLIKVSLEVIDPAITYEAKYANTADASFKDLSSTTCTTLKTVGGAKGFAISPCVTMSMSAPVSGTGIAMNMLITVLNNGRTDSSTLIGVGATLISGVTSLTIDGTKITRVAS